MGLISDSLSLDDQAIIRDLSTEIVQTMRRARRNSVEQTCKVFNKKIIEGSQEMSYAIN
jgi:hypothetical protein